MLSFKLLFEAVHKHSTHIEDLAIVRGSQGIKDAVDSYKAILDALKNKTSVPVSVKVDGCVHGDTLVQTKNGAKKISELTNEDYVKGFNIHTLKYEYSKCTLPRFSKGVKKWVKVLLENGSEVVCTEDHPFLCEDYEYVEARILTGKYIHKAPLKSIKVANVISLDEKYDQWDLTTKTENFVAVVGNEEIVLHNSPAVFCGYLNKKFFIATKSLFNKVPKINYSEADIDANHTGDLAKTLKFAFKYLQEIVPDNGKIYQGDLLYVKENLFSKVVDGLDSWCFQPNTIMYTVPKDSPLGKRIAVSNIGICFHTHYTSDGVDPKSISLTDFGVKENEFKKSRNVFAIDPYHKNESATALLTPEQSVQLENIIKDIEKANNGISPVSDEMQYYLLIYINTLYKFNMVPADKRFDGFLNYLEEMMNKKVAEKKSQKGQEAERLKWIKLKNDAIAQKTSLNKMFLVHSKLNDAKLIIKSYLDKLNSAKNFFVKKDGTIEVAGEEGYVIINGNANACKIVDRCAFSKVNFDVQNIYQKGWAH